MQQPESPQKATALIKLIDFGEVPDTGSTLAQAFNWLFHLSTPSFPIENSDRMQMRLAKELRSIHSAAAYGVERTGGGRWAECLLFGVTITIQTRPFPLFNTIILVR
jgi:hypothetical protein